MHTAFKNSFFRDAKKMPVALRAELADLITTIEGSPSLKDIPNLKKLKGHSAAYRIRIGNYRLCFFFENDTVTIVRFLPRKDVYRFFP